MGSKLPNFYFYPDQEILYQGFTVPTISLSFHDQFWFELNDLCSFSCKLLLRESAGESAIEISLKYFSYGICKLCQLLVNMYISCEIEMIGEESHSSNMTDKRPRENLIDEKFKISTDI